MNGRGSIQETAATLRERAQRYRRLAGSILDEDVEALILAYAREMDERATTIIQLRDT